MGYLFVWPFGEKAISHTLLFLISHTGTIHSKGTDPSPAEIGGRWQQEVILPLPLPHQGEIPALESVPLFGVGAAYNWAPDSSSQVLGWQRGKNYLG